MGFLAAWGAAEWLAAASVAAGAAGAASSYYSSNKQAKATAAAAAKQEEIAEKEAESNRQAARKADSQQADVSAILAQNATSGLGSGATMLSGTSGVSTSSLNLGGGGKLGA